MDKAIALWHDNASHSSLQPVSRETESLQTITSCFSMVSSGTEKLVASGGVDQEFTKHMSVPYQQGDFSLPVKYGYSLVGHTEDNKLVHVMHPHQSIAFVEEDALFYLPEAVSPEQGALISNMETVVNALWDSELFFPQGALRQLRIAVVGFGNIGALLALTLRKSGAGSAVVVEDNQWKQQQASQLGFETSNKARGDEFDLIFHCSGTGSGLQWCLTRASLEGVIIDLSWYGTLGVNLCLGREFHYRRLRLISSQVSRIPGHKSTESYYSRKVKCAELLMDPVYARLIHKVPFAQAPEFFANLRTGQLAEGFIWLFDYQSQEVKHV